jgi:hypothetical protein
MEATMARKKVEQPYYVGEEIQDDFGNVYEITSVDKETFWKGHINWNIGMKNKSNGKEEWMDAQGQSSHWQIVTPSFERLFK